MGDGSWQIREITPDDNAAIAEIIRYNLKNHSLDIPGTVYFDPHIFNLCEFYQNNKGRGYFVLTDPQGNVAGGIGFAEFEPFCNCAELQKLYLADIAKGQGFGYRLIGFIEDKMRRAGYTASYLETHHNLAVAMHTYERCGYRKIDRPKEVAHGAMDNFYYKEL